MRRIALMIVVVAAVGHSLAAQDLDRLFRNAEDAETVDHNCKGAIEQYKKVADGSNRALAAKALLRMAGCHQKLGDAQAQQLYERIVRDYGEQVDIVSQAQARLADTRGSTGARRDGISLRRVWSTDGTLSGDFRSMSADGRLLAYAVDASPISPSVIRLRDVISGVERPLTNETPGDETSWPLLSTDGKQVVYVRAHGPYELRIASLAGGGVPASRTLFGGPEVADVVPMDWSRDGKLLAVIVARNDRTRQIGVVSVPEGQLKVLESLDWNGRPSALRFSPDGRDLAFDLQVNGTSERHVMVVAVDGSRELAVVTGSGSNRILGWTDDGRHLLFTSDSSGTNDLWVQPFATQRLRLDGAPQLVKREIGDVYSLGPNRNGGLYLGMRAVDQDIEVVSVDLVTGKAMGSPVKPIQRFAGTNRAPAWSPDGKSLAYVSERANDMVLAIRPMDTGRTREVPLRMDSLAWFRGLRWAPKGESLTAFGVDRNGRGGFFSIDPHNGEITRLAPFTPQGEGWSYEGAFLSPDATRMYYHTRYGWIRERDMTSGTERVIVAGGNKSEGMDPDKDLGLISLSPDGRWFASHKPAYRAPDGSTRFQSLVLIPVAGGAPREILHVNKPEWLDNESIPWTPDGRSLVIRKMIGDSGSEVWLVPVDGGAPRRLDVFANQGGTLHVSPDGRQLATTTYARRNEVWLLENIIPAATK